MIATKTSANVTELVSVLQKKWTHVLPIPSAFESELFRWRSYWKRHSLDESSQSVTSLLVKHEAERSLSCVRLVHTWLRSTMTTERLSDLACIAMHSSFVPISRDQVCEKYMAIHPRRMASTSLLHN